MTPLGDLDPEDALKPPPERRRDPDTFIESLHLSFELGGRDVAALGAARATRVPPDATRTGTSIYLSGIDAMRVSLVQYQDSNRVYTNAASNYVTMDSTGYPATGMVVSISGQNGGYRSGTTTSEYMSWTSSTCGCTVYGADASYTMLRVAIVAGRSCLGTSRRVQRRASGLRTRWGDTSRFCRMC